MKDEACPKKRCDTYSEINTQCILHGTIYFLNNGKNYIVNKN